MKHLQELLFLSEAKTKKFFTLTIPAGCKATEKDQNALRINEGKDLDELIDAWMERNNAWRTEGPKGVQNFEKLIRALGYHNIDSFLEDNPGAIEAMFEWIRDQKIQEWKEALSEFDDKEDEE